MQANILSVIDKNAVNILIALLIVTIILLIISVIQGVRLARLQKKYKAFMKGSGKESLENHIIEIKYQIDRLHEKNKQFEEQINLVEKMSYTSLRGWGLIRFNAFQETGSDLSFSAAIVDGKTNGFVLTSIYGRDESRIYAKPLQGGSSTYKLSKEEEMALESAKDNMKNYKVK